MALTTSDIVLFVLIVVATSLALLGMFIYNEWVKRRKSMLSPYTGFPLRPGTDLPIESMKKILMFLYEKQEFDNRLFKIRQSAYCRETGRIFPESITFWGAIKVDWSFLEKKCPGNYVSWGSLTEWQQETIKEAHGSLEGFQIEFSSNHPFPRNVEPFYAYKKPGPLYVDLNTQVLLGWQSVPETEFEVLILQRPKSYWKKYDISIAAKKEIEEI